MTSVVAQKNQASALKPFIKTVSWSQIIQWIRERRWELAGANLVAVFATLLSIPLPLFLPLLVDEVLLHKPHWIVPAFNYLIPSSIQFPVIIVIVVLFLTFILRVMSLVLSVWHSRLFTDIAKSVTFRIRSALLEHTRQLDMAAFESLGSGKVASHLVTDIDTIDEFLGMTLSRTIVAILTLIGTAIILFWIHWPLAVIILLLNPLVIYFSQQLGRRVKHLKQKENLSYAKFQEALVETLDAVQQIRVANRQLHYFSALRQLASNVRVASSEHAWKSDALSRFSFVAFLLGIDLFRALALLMVLLSDLSIGEMFAVFGYLWFMMGPVQELLTIQHKFFGAEGAIKRINELFSVHRERQTIEPQTMDGYLSSNSLVSPFAAPGVSLSLENIYFSYDNETPVLENLNLSIRAGEKVALVGASGSGKSTLLNLILGLYQPNQGRILFNDINANALALDEIRQNVSTVLQHPYLFNTTLRENLSLGEKFSDKELWQSLEVAQLAETVRQLPHQLDTLIGRSGVRLSGGQRQRKIVILDEATSALDALTEHRLNIELKETLKNRTTLIIAHRLSAVQQSDRICVFDRGTIVEAGQHDQLVKLGGVYARLYAKQRNEGPLL
ncbi:MAG: ABC transporter ATP-binding protein [Pseudomonadota bacterium]